MTTTEMSHTWENFDGRQTREYETLVQITYHRTGPAFVITNMVEAPGWAVIPDDEWGCVEDWAHDHVAELVAEEYAEDEDENPGDVVLRQIASDIVRAEQVRA